MNAENWIDELKTVAHTEKIKLLSNFFKTGKGQYGEGDIFWGIVVPDNRAIAKKYYSLEFSEIKKLLQSEIHELRLSALFALVAKFEKSNQTQKKEIVQFYLANIQQINNWDLVDLSAPQIMGNYILEINDDSLLIRLSNSSNMWEQRIAIVATFTLIKHHHLDTTITLATKYMNHSHDLIHKATGWMLRELGKRDMNTLLSFLDIHAATMPRTALRYSVEKLYPELRKHYMTAKAKATLE